MNFRTEYSASADTIDAL